MPDIKSKYSSEQIAEYARANQLDLLNPQQIAAKFMEIEDRLNEIAQ